MTFASEGRALQPEHLAPPPDPLVDPLDPHRPPDRLPQRARAVPRCALERAQHAHDVERALLHPQRGELGEGPGDGPARGVRQVEEGGEEGREGDERLQGQSEGEQDGTGERKRERSVPTKGRDPWVPAARA